MQGAVDGLGNVVEDSRPGGISNVRPPTLRQCHRRIPAAQHMAHPVGVQKAHHHLFQLVHGQILPVGAGIIEVVLPDVVQHPRRQKLPGAAEGQKPAHLGGGNDDHVVVHQDDLGSLGFQGFLLLESRGLLSLVPPVENPQGRFPQNLLRILPGVEGQEHVRAHEQHQLRPGVQLFHRFQRFPGVADALPL